uniref:Zinc-ribbon domain-containing protein n=1 Tax=uncultured Armatimonadetes bacterium TaxID=157466 RepID=A0A6J4I2X1_9BACT|nr:hypothetical protein AVDCRST_MAG63-1335 [uncultured Armatimonadetes bacterium]
MAKCPGCGSDLNAAARFCALCGRAIALPPPPGATSPGGAGTMGGGQASARGLSDAPGPSSTDAGKRKVALAVGCGTALVAVAAFLLFRASGLLAAPTPERRSAAVLSAPPTQAPQAPVMNAPAPQAPPAPVVQAPRTAENPMPDDVIAYLRWLKQFEAARQNLEYRGMAELTVFTQKATTGALESLLNADPEGNPEPVKPENNPVAGIGKVIQDWNAAAQLFQQKTPPDACAPLATTYNQALVGGVARMSALHGTLISALQSIQGAGGQSTPMSADALAQLYRQKGTREGSIDVDAAYAQANTSLDTLRAQYTSMPDDVRTFDVKSGGGGMQLPFGMGM